MKNINSVHVGIIGLGYVGLPLAIEFGKKITTIGFDLKEQRIGELKEGIDVTREVSSDEFKKADKLTFTSKTGDMANCNVYIIAVPTPIDAHRRPDLRPLEGASRTVGQILKKGDIVIYESTVYPGATEEVCIPILEKVSDLSFNNDFFAGYSPERINPGDHEHRLPSIIKVTSGSTPEIAEFVDNLYKTIITAGTFKASSIKVAEAAKVIENTQRDVNIALVNELALIFNRLGINTMEVLKAAGTKWNFLPFRPGLVGGHCISVDPYYLTHKAQEVGYHPEMILAGRKLNDDMGRYIASQVVKLMLKKRIHVADANILIMGLSFKENCPDLRNTGVIDIIGELENYGANIEVFDPWVDPQEAERHYGVTMIKELPDNHYDAVVLAVAHREFNDLTADDFKKISKQLTVLYDVKHVLPANMVDGAL
jgi:UDP-N-acetyl-D-galactosamine dehydrogenase